MSRLLWGVILMTASMGPTCGGQARTFALPEPARAGEVAVEEAIERRRSVRDTGPDPLSLRELGQLAWAAQGITDVLQGLRAAPSAGATYPLEIDLLVTGMEELPDGVYRYLPREHALVLRLPGDQRAAAARAAFGQPWVRDAPVVMLISAVMARTEARYGGRAERYVHLEAGHAGQNVYLQATALGLVTVAVGAFDDDALARALGLADEERPLYLLPLGRSR